MSIKLPMWAWAFVIFVTVILEQCRGGVCNTSCSKNYTPIYTAATSRFNNAINSATSVFKNAIISIITSHNAKVDKAIVDFNNTDKIIDSALSSFQSSIGDQNSGVVGSYAAQVDSIIGDISSYLTSQIGNCSPTSGSSSAATLNANLESIVSDRVSVAYASLTPSIDSASKSFSDHITQIASLTFSSRLGSFSALYKTSINDMVDKSLVAMELSLAAYMDQIVTLDSDLPDLSERVLAVLDGFDNELRTITNKFNADSQNSANALDNSVRAVKYAGIGANDKVKGVYKDVNSYLGDKSTLITAKYSKNMDKFSKKIAETSDISYSKRLTNLINTVSPELISSFSTDRQTLQVAYTTESVAIRDSFNAVKSFLETVQPVGYFDSPDVRSWKRTTRNDAVDLCGSIINTHSSNFNNTIKSIDVNQIARLNNIGDRFTEDIRTLYVAGSSPNLATKYSKQYGDLVASLRDPFIDQMKSSMDNISDAIVDTRKNASTYADKVINGFPILRLVDIDIPVVIPAVDPTAIKMKIENSGGSAWTGYFGISAVDEDGKKYYHNVKPPSEITIPSKAIKEITVSVPFRRYFAGKTPQNLGISVVTNTFKEDVVEPGGAT